MNSGQDAGFFTTVSSNGTQNAIIWAVGRPVDSLPANVTLYAFDPVAAAQSGKPAQWVFSAVAGSWPTTGANANIVPVVANGHVYVASYKELRIFGFGSAAAVLQPVQTAPEASPPLPSEGHEMFGTIKTIDGGLLIILTRTGAPIEVDATEAVQAYQSVVLSVGERVRILGAYDTANVFHATAITRAKESSTLWPPDR